MSSNIANVFKVLESYKIELDGIKGGNISPKDIVEGHREKTLLLLWKLIFRWKVSVMLDNTALAREVAQLKRLVGPNDEQLVRFPDLIYFSSFVQEEPYFQSEQLSLLFNWCRLLGELHGVPIQNFTSSFADGRAFCVLLGHYHPEILPLQLMHRPREVRNEVW